jgi:hypothetical protein
MGGSSYQCLSIFKINIIFDLSRFLQGNYSSEITGNENHDLQACPW